MKEALIMEERTAQTRKCIGFVDCPVGKGKGASTLGELQGFEPCMFSWPGLWSSLRRFDYRRVLQIGFDSFKEYSTLSSFWEGGEERSEAQRQQQPRENKPTTWNTPPILWLEGWKWEAQPQNGSAKP